MDRIRTLTRITTGMQGKKEFTGRERCIKRAIRRKRKTNRSRF